MKMLGYVHQHDVAAVEQGIARLLVVEKRHRRVTDKHLKLHVGEVPANAHGWEYFSRLTTAMQLVGLDFDGEKLVSGGGCMRATVIISYNGSTVPSVEELPSR